MMNAVYSAALFVVKQGKKAVSCTCLQHANAVEEGTSPPAVTLARKADAPFLALLRTKSPRGYTGFSCSQSGKL